MTTQGPADERSEPEQERIEAEAADWVVRLSATEDDPDTAAALDNWRRADPRHAQAYQHALYVWRLMGVAAVPPPLEEPPRRAARTSADRGRARARRGPGLRRSAVIAAAVALAVVALWRGPETVVALRADVAAAHGSLQETTLPDGGRLTLDSGSAVAIDYDGAERRVRLLSGRLYVETAPDATDVSDPRPFVVLAGERRVEALGTAFAVSRVSGDPLVTVFEKAVRLAGPGIPSNGVRVEAGHRAAVGAEGVDVRAAARSEQSWRDGRLVFDRMQAGEVAARLNRYLDRPIVLSRPGLADRRVSGAFRIGALDSAPAVVARAIGAKTAEIPGLATVLY